MSVNTKIIKLPRPGRLLRPRYFPRQVVTAADLESGEDYFRERLRRHNRLLHGYGVICGLQVTVSPGPCDQKGSPCVTVQPGFALSADGDEIWVPEAQTVPVCVSSGQDCLALAPAANAPEQVFLVLRYAEQPVKSVPALPERCGPQAGCEFARYEEDFTITCEAKMPPGYGPEPDCDQDLVARRCGGAQACGGARGPDVLLACLTATPGANNNVTLAVDMSCRREVHSAAELQHLLCCLPDGVFRRLVPVRVTDFGPTGQVDLTQGGQVTASAAFDKPLDPTSVTQASVHVFWTDPATGAATHLPGQVTYDAATRKVTFTATDTPRSFAAIRVTVTLLGDGLGALRDTNGLRLDGDKDGNEGGNFAWTFSILTIGLLEVPINLLPGLTVDMVDKLQAAGITNVGTLRARPPDDLANILNLPAPAVEILQRVAVSGLING